MNAQTLPPDQKENRQSVDTDTRLLSASEIRREFPMTPTARQTVYQSRKAIENVLRASDASRLMVICGPCSIHDINAAMEYATKLRKLSKEVSEKLILVMRTYFEKPRSVVGWKGLLYDPDLQGRSHKANGLSLSRRLLNRINEIGIPCATEFLNPLLAPYLEDGIAYGSIGSRTAESQIHRELASGLTMPIGMKNGMEGDIETAVNATKAARKPHAMFGMSQSGDPAIIETTGNPYTHVFLRGGRKGPNYDSQSLKEANNGMSDSHLKRPVMIDCSHGNSGKDHKKQAKVAREVISKFVSGHRSIAGIMLESNLFEGQQTFRAGKPHCYGQSITDSCIGWEETESLILEIAERIRV